jgi:hypothetical protein
VEATEGDEVKGFGFLESLQAIGHGAIVTPLGPCRGPAHRDKAAMNGAQLPIPGEWATCQVSRGFAAMASWRVSGDGIADTCSFQP